MESGYICSELAGSDVRCYDNVWSDVIENVVYDQRLSSVQIKRYKDRLRPQQAHLIPVLLFLETRLNQSLIWGKKF